ncbi:helicase C-terminal domain-containing protein [Nocardioides sp. J2M5]|uniref:helicase C-terminal domain-containing protein n=1 Tax=Nocardioides palaemonis TaxID=2829810 RepID=UPI001BA78832|nr:helicase C-terminal domain-containing protein [Nocardioides palaemonis]MBS2939385.1 helicase C-terminal domain-containing protein [Nocardioides palaemonis]
MSSQRRATPARTLADQLRGWPDERLVALLGARPDLATPAPQDSAQLASRAATRSSIHRALDGLDRLELSVLDALVVVGQTTPERLVEVVHADPDRTAAALQHLLDLALAWEAPGGVRALTGVADAMRGAPGPLSGLRPSSPEPASPEVVATLVDELSPAAQALLRHVDAHGGEGTTGAARRTVTPADASSPAEELLARRLLVPREGSTVVLPGEVGLALRGGRTTTEPVDDVPGLATSSRDPDLVARTAAGAAFDVVRRVELLLDQWGVHPPGVLRSGGLAVRDLKEVARDLHVDEGEAALLVEVALASGLVAEGTQPDGSPAWLPTDEYDVWSGKPMSERWARLVGGWLSSSRVPSLVGSRDAAGKTWNALSPELSSGLAEEARRLALRVWAETADGEVLAAGTGTASLVRRVEWLRPRRPTAFTDLVAAALAEAAVLGVGGAGGLPPSGRLVAAGDLPGAAAAIDDHLPQPVDHVLLQADLTAVAPGPLETEVARRLHLLADVESRGGATVYRFSAGSLRRAFDAGWSAAEVREFLGSVSRTPVPQPLDFLVDDVSRTFGSVRVGHAEAFLRADDEAALAALVHDPRARTLGLRLLAPTVAIATSPLDVLLPRLRELGAAPVVEAADGTVRVSRPDLQRARSRRGRRPAGAVEARQVAQVQAVATAIRAGDRAESSRPPTAATTTPSGALAALREAIESGTTVVIGYVDNHGATGERVVEPRRLDGGRLSAFDHRSDDLREFAVHRITGVRRA